MFLPVSAKSGLHPQVEFHIQSPDTNPEYTILDKTICKYTFLVCKFVSNK